MSDHKGGAGNKATVRKHFERCGNGQQKCVHCGKSFAQAADTRTTLSGHIAYRCHCVSAEVRAEALKWTEKKEASGKKPAGAKKAPAGKGKPPAKGAPPPAAETPRGDQLVVRGTSVADLGEDMAAQAWEQNGSS